MAIQSARQFVAGLPLAVTPITLRPRFAPGATGNRLESTVGELPSQVDVRQMVLLGAGWTAVSLKYLAESGAHSATYYETTGWRGVMETEAGSPLPEAFRSLPGSVFPLYHVLADVGDFAGGQVVPTSSSDSLPVDGLALCKDDRTRVLLANLSASRQRVKVENLSERVRVLSLDEMNAESAMSSPESHRAQPGDLLQTDRGVLELDLLPYAVVRVDEA